MFFWFAGGSIVLLWLVFRSTRMDYRLLVAGAVLASVENVTGRDWFLHTLAAPLIVLVVVMVATRRSRLRRRRWLCVAIGMFANLVLDGVWTRRELFWWPVFGLDFPARSSLVASRPLAVNLALEAIGIAALVWAWKRFELSDPRRRHRLWTTGTLDPALARGPEAGM